MIRGYPALHFTPRDESGRRFKFLLAVGQSVPTGGRWLRVLRLTDGRVIRVRGLSCGLPSCHCDALLLAGPYRDRELRHRWRDLAGPLGYRSKLCRACGVDKANMGGARSCPGVIGA